MFLNKTKEILLIVFTNIIITALLLFVVEFISSLFADKIGSNLMTNYRINHTFKPNSKKTLSDWISTNTDFQKPYTHFYNSQGWVENYDITVGKEPNTYRIFYIGDSFTEGTAPMDQSVPSIVEYRLNELAKGNNIKFEVINTGTSSYSPSIYYLLVRYVLMDYSPDLIVVNIDMTDDFDDWKYSQTLILDTDGNPWAVPPRYLYNAPYVDTKEGVVRATGWIKLQLFLAQHSHTYNLIRQHITPRNSNDEVENTNDYDGDKQVYQRWAWCKKEWDEFTIKNVNHTLDILKRLAIFCQENNFKVLYTSVPHYEQYARNKSGKDEPIWSSRPHYEIERIAKENRVPYLNSFEKLTPIITYTPQEKYYYKGDMHFNPRGYQIWAQAHIDFLIDAENNLLPKEFY